MIVCSCYRVVCGLRLIMAMQRGSRRNLYFITLSLSIVFVVLGVSSTWSTPVLTKFKYNETNVDINMDQIAIMFSLYPVGFATGSLATRYIADRFGRRATILASAVPIVTGSVIVIFALKAWLLYITAFTWQCGTGMISTVIGYYFTEIADKDIRATLQLITGFTFKFGTLLTMILGPFISYDTLNYIMLALSAMPFILCWWIPETPYFYLRNGNIDGARKSLRILRGYKDDVILEEELLALRGDVQKEMRHSGSVNELFTKPQYRKAIIIAAGLKMTQIMTGGVQIKQYLGLIIKDTKLKLDIEYVFIIYGCVTFVIAMMSSVLVDRVGRRPLLIYSCVGTGLSLASVAIYFLVQDVLQVDSDLLARYSVVPFIGILLSTIISILGYNSLIFVIPAEVFPLNVKAVAMTSLSIFGSILAFTVSHGYQKIFDFSGLATVFFIFVGFAIGGAIFCYYLVIETKGKSLRDIQNELQGDFYNDVPLDEQKVKVADSCEKEDVVELEELSTDKKY